MATKIDYLQNQEKARNLLTLNYKDLPPRKVSGMDLVEEENGETKPTLVP